MMTLGSISVQRDDQVLIMRRKLFELARGLRFSERESALLALASSELARPSVAAGESTVLRVSLSAGNAPVVSLQFDGWASKADHPSLRSVFTVVEGTGDNLHLRRMLSSLPPSEELTEIIKRFQHRSRGELLADLNAQNLRLERARDRLEMEVASRTRELAEAADMADSANRAKSVFLSSMSHELRTPLNGVLGYAQILLRDAAFSTGQQKNLKAIESCGQHLLALINDVLDLSKIESGRVEVARGAVDIRRLVSEVMDITGPQAAAKNLRFECRVDTSVPDAIITDGPKVRQVLINLVGNAVKFTEQGFVDVGVSAVDADEDAQLQLTVTDSGVGVDVTEQQSIFEPFLQSTSGHVGGGTGLGLAISRRLVRALGGDLTLSSEPGKGSRFTAVLPLVRTSDQAPSLTSTRPTGRAVFAPNQAVLVADDNEVNRDILRQLLWGWGLSTHIVRDGSEALSVLEREAVDLALIDLQMPVLDGMATARAIRKEPRWVDLPLVAISASTLGDVRRSAHEAGFDAFVTKPFHAESLKLLLAKHLSAHFSTPPPGTPPPEPDPGTEPLPACSIIDAAWLTRLQSSCEVGDVAGLRALANDVSVNAPELARRIVDHADNFEFEELAEYAKALLEETPHETR